MPPCLNIHILNLNKITIRKKCLSWGTLEQIIKPENFFTFPSVSGPIWRSAPRARCLDQPDGGRWYWNHSTVKPLSIRLLLVQSPGYQSRWRQPTKPALKPIQDQPCRWYTWSPSRKKKSCNVYFENSHWLNHILGVFSSSWWKSIRCSGSGNWAWQLSDLLDSKLYFC